MIRRVGARIPTFQSGARAIETVEPELWNKRTRHEIYVPIHLRRQSHVGGDWARHARRWRELSPGGASTALAAERSEAGPEREGRPGMSRLAALVTAMVLAESASPSPFQRTRDVETRDSLIIVSRADGYTNGVLDERAAWSGSSA